MLARMGFRRYMVRLGAEADATTLDSFSSLEEARAYAQKHHAIDKRSLLIQDGENGQVLARVPS